MELRCDADFAVSGQEEGIAFRLRVECYWMRGLWVRFGRKREKVREQESAGKWTYRL